MSTPRPCRLQVDGLERREMLSGASTALPYSELTIKGHFSTTEVTTVTFAAKGYPTATETPTLVTKGMVEVAVPPFFNPTTAAPAGVTASVTVTQAGSTSKPRPALKALRIAPFPQTGLAAGDVLGAVSVAAESVAEVAAGGFSFIAANDPAAGASAISAAGKQVAAPILNDLDGLLALAPLAQGQLVALATGAIPEIDFGTLGGQAATLKVADLSLLDRGVAAEVDDSAGKVVRGAALIGAMDNLVTQAVAAGPAAVIGESMSLLQVLTSATGQEVVPPGDLVAGLGLAALSAILGAAGAEGQILQGAFTPGSTLGAADLAMVDQVVEDPTLGLALKALAANFTPTGPDGAAAVQAVGLVEDLAVQLDTNIPGSAGARFASYLAVAPLHGG